MRNTKAKTAQKKSVPTNVLLTESAKTANANAFKVSMAMIALRKSVLLTVLITVFASMAAANASPASLGNSAN